MEKTCGRDIWSSKCKLKRVINSKGTRACKFCIMPPEQEILDDMLGPLCLLSMVQEQQAMKFY